MKAKKPKAKIIKRSSIKIPVILMAWPAVAIVGSTALYALVNLLLGNPTSFDPLRTAINLLLFLIGVLAIIAGPISFIVGLGAPAHPQKIMKPDYPIIAFASQAEWRQWLDDNHADLDGIWIKIAKKATNIPTVTHAEALDDALCYGWIDGQRKGNDDESFLQKFTPRRKASLWSKRNIEYIAKLTEAGLMMPAGIAEVERAQQDGRWDAAYDAQSTMVVPERFMTELRKFSKAYEFYESLNKTNKFAIGWRLQTAKTEETFLRRQDKILQMLKSGEKIY